MQTRGRTTLWKQKWRYLKDGLQLQKLRGSCDPDSPSELPKEPPPADTLISDFQPLGLRGNTLWFFEVTLFALPRYSSARKVRYLLCYQVWAQSKWKFPSVNHKGKVPGPCALVPRGILPSYSSSMYFLYHPLVLLVGRLVLCIMLSSGDMLPPTLLGGNQRL